MIASALMKASAWIVSFGLKPDMVVKVELPTMRNHPFSTAGGPIAIVLREQVSQIFHSGGA